MKLLAMGHGKKRNPELKTTWSDYLKSYYLRSLCRSVLKAFD